MNTMKRIVLAFAALSGAIAAFAQDSGHPAMHGNTSSATDSMAGMHGNTDASKAPFDQQFLDTMTMHHQHGIQMAQLVESRSANDQLKQLATKMAREQQQEIKQMQDMKQRWYGGKRDAANMQMPGMKESMASMGADMKKLEASKGQEFDALFIDAMRKHHQDAIKMTRNALSEAQHPEVKQMAKKMSEAQQKEISKLAALKPESASTGQ